MGTVQTPPAPASLPASGATSYSRWRFNRDEFYKLGECGLFADRRVELINGEVVAMAAQGNWHAWAVKAAQVALDAAFGPNYWVRAQMNLDLTPLSVPEPDMAVIAGSFQTHRRRANPTTALLVVEVSETSLADDQTWKSSLYAAAGIADYWIVDLVHRQLEVRRNPQPDPAQDFGAGYAAVTVHQPGEFVSPLALPAASVAVADLLP